MTKLRTTSITWLCSAHASAQCFWSCVTDSCRSSSFKRAVTGRSEALRQSDSSAQGHLLFVLLTGCKHQSQTGRELSRKLTAHHSSHRFYPMDTFNYYYYFFTSYSCSLTHDQWLQQPPPSGLRVCQEPQAAYYSITLLYIGCWQLNTWIHERREHSKWTSKSQKTQKQKKRKTETRNIRKLYDWMCLM